MNITYTEQSITILPDEDGATVEVTAMVADNGLAYHRIPCNCDECISYNVSHIKTGRVVAGYFDDENQAKEFIRKVADLCDWTEDYPDPPTNIKELVGLAAILCHQPIYATTEEAQQ